jgi:tetratricopeptide (TPR) repeat protein
MTRLRRLCRPRSRELRATLALVLALLLVAAAGGCRSREVHASASRAAASPPQVQLAEACTFALAPQQGAQADDAIARLRQSAATATRAQSRIIALNELGQQLIAKARATHDLGYYQRAEDSATCVDTLDPGNAQALLLRGHLLHQAHRFKEAERLARQVVAKRGMFLDYGLLGDALMEQGKLDEAGEAYQHMMNLKPYYQSYTRAAHLRWLKGDLAGATTLIRLAIKAASPRDPEAVAWAYTRLAMYELQAGAGPGGAGHLAAAKAACDAALTYQPGYPAALLTRGRLLLAERKPADAVLALQRAAAADPVPEYQWALADALDAAGRANEARAIDASIQQSGSASDPRTFAVYLATRGSHVDLALKLAQRELDTRADVFTVDALAWSLAAAGRAKEADEMMKHALDRGTVDARLFYHAGVIAGSVDDPARSRRWLRKAKAMQQMLLPSEQSQVARALAQRTAS